MQTNGKRVIQPPAEKPLSLAELLERVTPDNLHGEWDSGRPVGREVW